MDLSDFDSTLLNWDDDDGPSREPQQGESDGMGSASTSGSQTPLGGDSEHGLKRPFSTQATKEGFSRLPSFPTLIGGFSTTCSETNGQSSNPAATTAAASLTNPYAMQMLYPLTGQNVSTAAHANGSTSYAQQQQNLMVQYALTGQSAGAPFPSFSFQNKSQVDTISSLSTTTGILSSTSGPAAASLPRKASAHSSEKTTVASSTSQPVAQLPNQVLPPTQLHPLGIQSSAVCPPMPTTTAPVSASNPMPQFNPYMFNPYSMMASNPQLFAAFQSSQQQAMAAQYAAAAQASAAVQASQAQAPAVLEPAPQANSPAAVFPPPPAPAAKVARKPRAQKQKGKKASKSKDDDAPPFLLFDAPCELRHNFMNTQRMLNLPVHQDGNSYHYGMSVNGFHPQLNVATDPIRPLSSRQPILPAGVNNVKLLDSRHKKRKGAGKERNEREQKRAQKITELIDQIRTSMEDGGWKVEMKSKYNTLSMCADYVKHLIKSTEEKEEAVEKAKSDLEVKERNLEEDKALLEGRSDPESVTSSLTASTAGSRKAMADGASGDAKPTSDASSGSKRKAEELEQDVSNDVEPKKAKEDEAKADESNEDMSGADDGSSGPSGHNISIGKMSSCMSELTDSNRGSSDSGGEKRGSHDHAAHKKRPRSDDDDESSDLPSTSSISSTAAVLRGTGSHHREHGHADVVIKEKKHSRHRKRLREERSSLDRKFVVDYEEVFLTSNVPQIIATPAGRIVAWNTFFLKATGLEQDAVQRLTIFSLVQPDKLANLFEMVAEALRQKPESECSSSATSSSAQTTNASAPSSTEGSDAAPHATEYAAMTLPCTSFLTGAAASDESEKSNPLYMTMTLMPDEDARKRCFHCVFTDCKGTDGKLGFITPKLLAKLFAEPETVTEKLRPRTPDADKAEAKLIDESEEMEIEVNSAVDGAEDGDE